MNEVTITNPVLIDGLLYEINDNLKKRLIWLNAAFGKAYKLQTRINWNTFDVPHKLQETNYTYPAVHIAGEEYMSVLPNDNIGNFSFFHIYDPQTVATVSAMQNLSLTGALVFWIKYDTIYEDGELNTEVLKKEILNALTSMPLRKGGIKVTSVSERLESVYKEYNFEKYSQATLDKKYLMFPYCGLCFELTLKTRELC